jgi:tetratricopeptide (TPR) repeat protein
VSIFFLPTSTHCETALVSPNTLKKASLVLTTAEDAIKNENYDTARTHLFEVASWQLDDTQTLFRLGLNCIKIGEFQKSVVAFKRILNRDPNNVTVLYNTGYALKNDGQSDEAILYYKKVLERNPNNDAANLALGYAYLNKGDFTNGWVQHERYLKNFGKYASELRALLANTTVAEHALAGKRILLTPEGGLGDTINFIQCAQLLRYQGASVIASVQKPLFKLLQSCTCVDEVITGLPTGFKYDARVTYMSLPAALYLDETTMPKHNPYLHADLLLVDFWKKKLAHDTSFKVGVCWQADLPHDESRLPVARRSIPLALLAELADIPDVTLYSLQTHEHNTACTAPEIAGKIQTFEYKIDTEHGPFMDTAALIANMDIVITVDTATAHLAAALGKPTWLLLPYATDWRWIAHRTDSPWHPTMRIFKQAKPFDWQSVINDVTQALMLLYLPKNL